MTTTRTCRFCRDAITPERITGTTEPVPNYDGSLSWVNRDDETWCAIEDPNDPDGFAENPHTPEV
jgi:hypothetical protein